MKIKTKILIASAALLTIQGCAKVQGIYSDTMTKLNLEAGGQVDEGGFGNPNMNNTLAQAAYLDQNGLILDLGRKFAAAVPSTINFAFNSARLDAEAKQILTQQAQWMRPFAELRFRVYGHTDAVGSAAYNKKLGYRRAKAAVNYLISQGVDPARLEAVASFGETQPLIVTEGRSRENRRTVTEVAGFARNLKGEGLDGKYALEVYKKYTETLGGYGGGANEGAAPSQPASN